jgi:hypothetical protein
MWVVCTSMFIFWKCKDKSYSSSFTQLWCLHTCIIWNMGKMKKKKKIIIADFHLSWLFYLTMIITCLQLLGHFDAPHTQNFDKIFFSGAATPNLRFSKQNSWVNGTREIYTRRTNASDFFDVPPKSLTCKPSSKYAMITRK